MHKARAPTFSTKPCELGSSKGVRNVVHVMGEVVPNDSPSVFPNVKLDFSRPALLSLMAQALAGKSTLSEQSSDGDSEAVEILSPIEDIIHEFCSVGVACRVKPSVAEMEVVALKCAPYSDGVVEAIHEQLTWTNGDTSWQHRFRALCLIEHFHSQGEIGRRLAKAVYDEDANLLPSLMDIPQCCEKAMQVLQLISDSTSQQNQTFSECKPELDEYSTDIDEYSTSASSDVDEPFYGIVTAL
jgi:hypothetical protein